MSNKFGEQTLIKKAIGRTQNGKFAIRKDSQVEMGNSSRFDKFPSQEAMADDDQIQRPLTLHRLTWTFYFLYTFCVFIAMLGYEQQQSSSCHQSTDGKLNVLHSVKQM